MKTKRVYILIVILLLAAFFLKDDVLQYAKWLIALFGLGVAFFPLTNLIFDRFNGRGYFFSKIIGLAVAGYLTWLFAMLKLLPFTAWSAAIVLVACVYVNYLINNKTKAWAALFKEKGSLNHAIGQEAILMLTLLFWSYMRGIKPEIIGLEKFMDFGFVNSILRGTYFPPVDMWYASEPINYYYLGHYFAAYLTRISFVPSEISYNLMMASLFALSFTAAYNIGNFLMEICSSCSSGEDGPNKIARVFCGCLSGALVTLGGSLHAVIYAVLAKAFSSEPKSYWFPDATRYIGFNPLVENDGTIHEFPLYSYVVSDLHAHVLNMIFVLTVIAASIAVGMKILSDGYGWRREGRDGVTALLKLVPGVGYFLVVFLIGLFPATNFWDFPIYIVVSNLIILFANLRKYRYRLYSLELTVVQAILGGLMAYAVLLPFHFTFDAISSKIERVVIRTPFYQLMVLYGYQMVFFIILINFVVYMYNIRPKDEEGEKSLPTLFRFIDGLNPSDAFALILFSCAAGLIIIPELIYVKDIYPTSPRANTMFKLTYQACIMMTLAIGYTFTRICLTKRLKLYLLIPMLPLLAIGFVYSYFAINQWYAPFNKNSTYKGLDGVKYMLTYEEQLSKLESDYFPEGYEPEEPYPMVRSMESDYDIVQYINKNIKGQPVVAEACSNTSYTSFGRIAVNTGVPDIFNWYTHQWLWRNADFDAYNERVSDVELLYTTDSPDEARRVIDKYAVKYIVIGKLERARYRGKVNEELLHSLGDVACQSGDSVLIEVRG